jgi:hypothetical protein
LIGVSASWWGYRPLMGAAVVNFKPLTNPAQSVPADQRHRLSWWCEHGFLAPGIAPATIAAAFTRATGRPPARDPAHKQSRAYSALELLQALAQLGPTEQRQALAQPSRPRQRITVPGAPPPPRLPVPARPQPPTDPLAAIWAAALQRLELPSTRMMLSQQARLLGVTPAGRDLLLVVVGVAPQWRRMIESRAELVREALAKALRRPVALRVVDLAELVEVGR